MRGAYSSPQTFWDGGGRFDDYGIDALFLHSSRVDGAVLARAEEQGARVYAEFATFRGDHLLERHPDVAPIGRDGLPAPGTKRVLGACPTCPGVGTETGAPLPGVVRATPGGVFPPLRLCAKVTRTCSTLHANVDRLMEDL